MSEDVLNAPFISIIADHRERDGGVIEALRALDEVRLTIATLPLGDYQVNSQLLFERKTLLDFAASIKDGRVFRQAARLVQSPFRSVIILEGTAADLAKSNIRREVLQGALINLSLILGIPILRSLNPTETARLILYAAKQIHALAHGALPRHGVCPRGKRRTQLYILQGLPGVGPHRAKQLIESFGSVEAVLSAGLDELLTVPGVGRKTAEAIRWAVSEKQGEYGEFNL